MPESQDGVNAVIDRNLKEKNGMFGVERELSRYMGVLS